MSDIFKYLGLLCILILIIIYNFFPETDYKGNIMISFIALAPAFFNTSNVLDNHNLKKFKRRDILKFYVAIIAYLFSLGYIVMIFI